MIPNPWTGPASETIHRRLELGANGCGMGGGACGASIDCRLAELLFLFFGSSAVLFFCPVLQAFVF